MNKKEHEKIGRFYIANIVISPESSQYPERYIELLQDIFNQKITVVTHFDKATRIRTLFKNEDLIYGKIANCSYIDPKKPALDLSTNEPTTLSSYDFSTAPNLREWDYFFIPAVHKFIFPCKSGVSRRQIEKFLISAFNTAISSTNEEINISIVTSSEIIERIIDSEGITSLYVSLSYSNNDLNEDWAQEFDDDLRNSDTRRISMKSSATKKAPIIMKKSKFLQALVLLAKKNGKARATILENGNPVMINTEEHPEILSISYTEEEDLKSKLLSIFRKNK